MKLTKKQQNSINNLKPYESNYWSLRVRLEKFKAICDSHWIEVLEPFSKEAELERSPEAPPLVTLGLSFNYALEEPVPFCGEAYIDTNLEPSYLEQLLRQADLLADPREPDLNLYGYGTYVYQSKTWVDYPFSLKEYYIISGDNPEKDISYLLKLVRDFDEAPPKSDLNYLVKQVTEYGSKKDKSALEFLKAVWSN